MHYIGEIFIDSYDIDVAQFCNDSQSTDDPCALFEIEPQDEHRRFQIQSTKLPPEEEEKQRKLTRINELQIFLDSTDWYCSRYVDIGTPIPEDIKQQRSDARIEIDRLRHELEPIEDTESDTESDTDPEAIKLEADHLVDLPEDK